MNATNRFFAPPPAFSQILFFFFLLVPALLDAQHNPCMGWGIEITKTPYEQVPGNCVDGTGACDNFYYYVYLIKNGGGTTSVYEDFNFGYVSVTGDLAVYPLIPNVNTTGTGHPLSRLDGAASLSCLPEDGGSFEVTNSDHTFTYSIGTIYPEGDAMLWSVADRRLICVIAVQAYYGEIVDLTNLHATLQILTPSHGSYTSSACDFSPLHGDLTKSLSAEPALCSPPLQVHIQSATNYFTTEYPFRKKVPVYLDDLGAITTPSFPAYVSELDFLLQVYSYQPMQDIYLESGIIDISEISLYREVSISTQDVRIHVSSHHVQQINSVANPLFYIIINGPALASACATTDISMFGPSRIRLDHGNGYSCCRLTNPANVQSISTGLTNCIGCNAQLSMQIKKVPFPSYGDKCADIYFGLEIKKTGTGNVEYTSGSIVVDINYTGTSLEFGDFNPDLGFQVSSSDVEVLSSPAGVLRLRLFLLPFSSKFTFYGNNTSRVIGTFKLIGTNVCVSRISFYDATWVENTTPAQTCFVQYVETEVGGGAGEESICLKHLSVLLQTQYNEPIAEDGIQDSEVKVTGICPTNSVPTDDHGLTAICDCTDFGHYILEPSKGGDPLNGVTTFDLVLISRHILGLEPLTNPYKLIAADADNSKSITTSDIVFLRKIILGFEKFPDGLSWRFLPWHFFDFSNLPSNPINPPSPQQIEFDIDATHLDPGQIRFYGVKLGDVNGTSLPNDNSTLTGNVVARAVTTLPVGFMIPSAQRGEVIEIPLFAQQTGTITAWQLALHYDTTQMKIKNVRWMMSVESDIYQWGDWNISSPGELRLSWFDRRGMAVHISTQVPLAYLQVEWLGDYNHQMKNALQLANTIPSEAYNSDGEVLTFVLSAATHYQTPAVPIKLAQAKPVWTVSVYPNPTSGAFRFDINLPNAGEGQVSLYDLAGRLVAQQNCNFTNGLNVITSQQFPPLIEGVYFVRFDTPLGRQTLRLVKK